MGFSPPQRKSVPLKSPVVADADAAEVLEPSQEDRIAAAAEAHYRGDNAVLDALASVLAGVRRLEDETSAADVLPSVLNQQHLMSKIAANAPVNVRTSAIGLASEIAQYLGWLPSP